jgi:hypothetical protein
LALLALFGHGDAAGPPSGGAVAALDPLLAEYRAHGLPLPPRGAKLVRYQSGGEFLLNGKVVPPRYSIAFLVKGGPAKGTASLLCGTRDFGVSKGERLPRPIAPKPAALGAIDLGAEESLLMAVQCRYLGWDDLARHLLARWAGEGRPARPALLRVAWRYWAWKIPNPNSDRALIAKRLKSLLASDKSLDERHHRALVRSLDLALVPGKGRPGTVEALIDDLVNYTGRTGTFPPSSPDDRYGRILKLGFAAVPALIDHLEDERLTRGVMRGFNNFPSWHLRVEHVVSDLLRDIAGQELGRDWLRRQQGYPVKKAVARAWWAGASKMGEEAYLLANVLPRGGQNPREGLLAILLAKYPRHVPKLYRKVLDEHPQMQSWDLARAVARGKLPGKEKVKLLGLGARSKNRTHRREALLHLKDLDKAQFGKIVLGALKDLPRDVEGPYWKCEEAFVAAFVPLTEDPRAWGLLEKVARRSSLGLRLELLNNVGRVTEPTPALRARLLALYASFLDDAAERDRKADPKRYDGPCAGFHYERLSVRDFAAMEMAWLLKIEVKLNPDRSAREWAALRAKVREAWKRERTKGKKG